MRFLSVDPLAADYAAWSGYNYVLGNPLRNIDSDGRQADDIVILSHGAKSGEGHKHSWGHQAILVGTDATGWTYMSYDADIGENAGNLDVNNNYTVQKFESLDAFKNSEHNTFKADYDDGKGLKTSENSNGKPIQRFDEAFQIVTTEEQDKKMLEGGRSTFTAKYSPLTGTDCTTVVSNALNAGGLKTGDTYTWPADKQREIERSNKGTDIDYKIKRD